MTPPWVMAAIMLLAGIGIPIMAALNGSLGGRLESPIVAAVILFAVALVAGCATLLASGALSESTFTNLPSPMYFAGGLFVAFYVLSITWVAPRFGVGNAVFFVLLGQLVSTAVIDHLGLFGAPVYEVSGQRIAGITLMAIGVFLAVQRT
ncbi:MAG: DMT family transporter [Pseudomonadaceae bacterium]|nr:DMT family transporter [Pseudomonadaceae bacterium]